LSSFMLAEGPSRKFGSTPWGWGPQIPEGPREGPAFLDT
jgi:hypothetical protein